MHPLILEVRSQKSEVRPLQATPIVGASHGAPLRRGAILEVRSRKSDPNCRGVHGTEGMPLLPQAGLACF